jgi:hypothetical protein
VDLGHTGAGRRAARRLTAGALDPGTGRVVARYPEVHGVAGGQVLWGGPERHAGPFILTDLRTGTSREVARPNPYGEAGLGLPSPDGRLLAVKRLPLPGSAGSDSFVPWPAPA